MSCRGPTEVIPGVGVDADAVLRFAIAKLDATSTMTATTLK